MNKKRSDGDRESQATLADAAGPAGAVAADLAFGDAIVELEDILRRIESDEIDLDALSAELRRATALLELCRAKVRRAEVEVRQIVAKLDAEDSPGPSGADDSEPSR